MTGTKLERVPRIGLSSAMLRSPRTRLKPETKVGRYGGILLLLRRKQNKDAKKQEQEANQIWKQGPKEGGKMARRCQKDANKAAEKQRVQEQQKNSGGSKEG